ncbi:MAG: hypothetical protein GY938_27205 [Ketobacter sp.]|nr:hypothetical protein [Ketobacter sp.]
MNNCKKCNSDRSARIIAKSSDRNSGNFDGLNFEGSIPYDIGIGGGDYVRFEWCLNCGTIAGNFPIAPIYEDDCDSYDNGGHPDNFGDR